MRDPAFADLPALDALGGDLEAAFARAEAEQRTGRREPRSPWPGWRGARPVVLAVVLALLIATAAAAATLLVLRGSPIPAPDPRDVAPEQTPAPGTARVVDVRAEDPGGGPAWGIRLSRSRTGLLCSTVGQIVGGEFGLTGLDGRFRAIPERVVDSCGERRDNAASLVGARVFAARDDRDVRTIVSGVGGDTLRAVEVEARGRTRDVPVGEGGTFIAALAGLPEDLLELPQRADRPEQVADVEAALGELLRDHGAARAGADDADVGAQIADERVAGLEPASLVLPPRRQTRRDAQVVLFPSKRFAPSTRRASALNG
jgi:hypothetical protein